MSMMRGAAVLLLPIMTLSCATTGGIGASQGSWCFEEHEQGVREQLTNVEVTPVRSERMAEAIHTLSRRSLVELSSAEAAAFIGAPALASGSRYFLVRANVTSPPQASLHEIIEIAAQEARYSVYWGPQDRSIALFVSQSIEGLRQENNIGVIVRMNVPAAKAYLGCFVTD